MTISPDNLKALILDLDDTLVVEEASAEAALLQTCELARTRHVIEPRDLHATVRQTCRRLWHQSPARTYSVDIGVSSCEALWAGFEGGNENLRILRDWAADIGTARHAGAVMISPPPAGGTP